MKNHVEIVYLENVMRGFHEAANSDKLVIIVHGIGGNKLGHKFIFKQLSDKLLLNNISSLRLDFVGTGESDGDFADTKHSEQVIQLAEIIKYARNKLEYPKIYLCSTTIGCYSVWHAAKTNDDIEGIINLNPILNFDRYEANHLKHANLNGSIDMKGLMLNSSYTKDLSKLKREIPQFTIPMYVIQGELDHEFKYNEAREHCELNMWKYDVIKDGDHLWNGNKVREELFIKIVEFINSN